VGGWVKLEMAWCYPGLASGRAVMDVWMHGQQAGGQAGWLAGWQLAGWQLAGWQAAPALHLLCAARHHPHSNLIVVGPPLLLFMLFFLACRAV